MWFERPAVETCLDARPPFSFYFDLVGAYWRALTPPLPLHRICTLARKQGVRWVTVEDALGRADVRRDSMTWTMCWVAGVRLRPYHLCSSEGEQTPENIHAVSEADFLGQAVLINYRRTAHPDLKFLYIRGNSPQPPVNTG